MPVYSYSASDCAERVTSGTLVADTPLEARQRLRDQGLRILDFASLRSTGSLRALWPGSKRRRHEEVAEVARYLSLLLRAGVPLAECFDVLTQRRSGRLATVLKDVRDQLTGGASLSDALALHSLWFDKLFVSAVRVGELSGNLDEALSELAEYLRGQETLRSRMTSALTYPLILLCLGVGVVVFLMSHVIPQLLTVLTAAGRPLPTSTMLLKSLSDLLVNHWVVILFGAGLIAVGLAAARRSPAAQRLWHRTQLRMPLIGPLVQKSLVAQFAQRMALLLRTGIPFVEAVRCVEALTANRILADELALIARAVESGSDIAPAMGGSLIFPPVVVHIVAVGQDSGELTQMLAELRTRYETEVRLAIEKFTAALEPLLIVVLASVVGFVVFACLMPILETTKGITNY